MVGLTEGERIVLEDLRADPVCLGGCTDADNIPQERLDTVHTLTERGLLRCVECPDGYKHARVTPEGVVALLCDSAVRGTLRPTFPAAPSRRPRRWRSSTTSTSTSSCATSS